MAAASPGLSSNQSWRPASPGIGERQQEEQENNSALHAKGRATRGLPWPDTTGLDLTKTFHFEKGAPSSSTMRLTAATANLASLTSSTFAPGVSATGNDDPVPICTIKKEHYAYKIDRSPYQQYIGPPPDVKARPTPSQIAKKRMKKICGMIGIKKPLAPSSDFDNSILFDEETVGGNDEERKNSDGLADRTATCFGPETISKWLEEANGLHVTLNQVLNREAETGEVSYPLLQDPSTTYITTTSSLLQRSAMKHLELTNAGAATTIKAAQKAYQLPRYEHTSPERDTSHQTKRRKRGDEDKRDYGSRRKMSITAAGSINEYSSRPTATSTTSLPRTIRQQEGGGKAEQRLAASSDNRLGHFLQQLENTKVLSPEEVKNLYLGPPPPLTTSMEMEERMKEVLERNLGTGPWQDIVGSTLAKPLEARLVYTEEGGGIIPLLRSASTTATAGRPSTRDGVETTDGSTAQTATTSPLPSSASLLTETLPGKTNDHFPKAEYLRRLAASHREEGRDDEALACLQQASIILQDRDKASSSIMIPSSSLLIADKSALAVATGASLSAEEKENEKSFIVAGTEARNESLILVKTLEFPYEYKVHRAATTIQRGARRRLARRHQAATYIAARYRGFVIRYAARLLGRKRLVASKMIQRSYRKRLKRLAGAAIQLQKLWRGYWVRELNYIPILRNKSATLIQSLARVILARKQLRYRWRRKHSVVMLQALYRGYLVRKTRYQIIRSLHIRWGQCMTLFNAHVRRHAGKRSFLEIKACRQHIQFERQQTIQAILEATMRYAEQHFLLYLQTPEGKAEIKQEIASQARSEAEVTKGIHGFPSISSLSHSTLVDMDLLRAALRPLWGAVDASFSGFIIRGRPLRRLLSSLGVLHVEAEEIAALTYSTDPTKRTLTFEGFCHWYQSYYHPKHRNSAEMIFIRQQAKFQRALHHYLPRPKAIIAIRQRHYQKVMHQVQYLLERKGPRHLPGHPPLFICLQCRQAFLTYRHFLDHFVGYVEQTSCPSSCHSSHHLSFAQLCPMNGQVGIIPVGLYGDRSEWAFQQRVNRQFIRAFDEQHAIKTAALAAEAKERADRSLPKAQVELAMLERCAELKYEQLSSSKDGDEEDYSRYPPLAGSGRVISQRRRRALLRHQPRVRSLGEQVAGQMEFNHHKKLQFIAAIKAKEQATWTHRAHQGGFQLHQKVSKLTRRPPPPRWLLSMIFEIFCCSNPNGGINDKEDLVDLCHALKMRFHSRQRAPFLSGILMSTYKGRMSIPAPAPVLSANVTKEGRLITFDVFYQWYMESYYHKVFVNGLNPSKAYIQEHVASLLLQRRAIVQAQSKALQESRQIRPARLSWTEKELQVIEAHCRRHPEVRCLLPSYDEHFVAWIEGSLVCTTKTIDELKALYRPRPPQPPTLWQLMITRWMRGRGGLRPSSSFATVIACIESADNRPAFSPEKEGYSLPIRHADAEMRRWLNETPCGRRAVKDQEGVLQRMVWSQYASSVKRDKDENKNGESQMSLIQTFLENRREFYGLPLKEEKPELACLDGMTDALVAYDYAQRGSIDKVEMASVLQQLHGVPVELIPPAMEGESHWDAWDTRKQGKQVDDEDEGVAKVSAMGVYEYVRSQSTSGTPLKKRKRWQFLLQALQAELQPPSAWWKAKAKGNLQARARGLEWVIQQQEWKDKKGDVALALKARQENLQAIMLRNTREVLRQNVRRQGMQEAYNFLSRAEGRLALKREEVRLRALFQSQRKVMMTSATTAGEEGSQGNLALLRYTFDLLDPEHGGWVDACLLSHLTSALGLVLHSNDLILLEQRLDFAGTGRIYFAEVLEWYTSPTGAAAVHDAKQAPGSRLLQLQHIVRDLLGWRFRHDAKVTLALQWAQKRCHEFDNMVQLLEDEDLLQGNAMALHDFRPWYTSSSAASISSKRKEQHKMLHFEEDPEGLLQLEAAAEADGYLWARETDLGACAVAAQRNRLMSQLPNLIASEDVTTSEGREKALIKYCISLFDEYVYDDFNDRYLVQAVGDRLNVCLLGAKMWKKERLSRLLLDIKAENADEEEAIDDHHAAGAAPKASSEKQAKEDLISMVESAEAALFSSYTATPSATRSSLLWQEASKIMMDIRWETGLWKAIVINLRHGQGWDQDAVEAFLAAHRDLTKRLLFSHNPASSSSSSSSMVQDQAYHMTQERLFTFAQCQGERADILYLQSHVGKMEVQQRVKASIVLLSKEASELSKKLLSSSSSSLSAAAATTEIDLYDALDAYEILLPDHSIERWDLPFLLARLYGHHQATSSPPYLPFFSILPVVNRKHKLQQQKIWSLAAWMQKDLEHACSSTSTTAEAYEGRLSIAHLRQLCRKTPTHLQPDLTPIPQANTYERMMETLILLRFRQEARQLVKATVRPDRLMDDWFLRTHTFGKKMIE